ncbi:MAG: ABC transporter permease [Pirellulales bacterium]|nr:ABC transporter permease [Pirellulales bacterium]
MSSLSLLLASLRHYWRTHAAVAVGVAIAAAVITGALVVGDSVRGSLRDRALAGLGRVDAALTAEQPFRQQLAAETLKRAQRHGTQPVAFSETVPLLTARGTLVAGAGRTARRATGLVVYGVPREFWRLSDDDRQNSLGEIRRGVPDGAELALSPAIAAELGANDGDVAVLRLPTLDGMPSDSVLGEKDDAIVAQRFRIAVVDPADEPMMRFALRPMQQEPRNAFVPLARLQILLKLPQRANVALFATSRGRLADAAARDAVASALRPTLNDYGLALVPIAGGENARGGTMRLAAERLVLPPEAAKTALQLFANAGAQPAVTYLANTIAVGERKIPYSTITGVDSTEALGPLLDATGEPIVLADDEIALNDWAAEALGAKVGDVVTVTYYLPETTHGELREAPPAALTLRAIVPLTDAEGRPTAAADPAFAPELPGVTDQASIDDWDLPFELVEKVGDADEAYWDARRTTPKAFVSHALAARLWGSRWGTDSVVRIPLAAEEDPTATAGKLQSELEARLDPPSLGMTLLPAKEAALRAASGTTPFDGLFLGFSMFLVASAVMLIALLFRLGIEQRASESGLLLAAGFAPAALRRLTLAEGAFGAALGAAIGAGGGIGYARLMIYGLNHWWAAAANAPFLRLHWTGRSVALGGGLAILVALAAMAWSLRKLVKLPPRQLLAGDAQPRDERVPTAGARPWAAVVAALAAAGLSYAGRSLEGEAQAGAFFGSGALALTAALAAVRRVLRRPSAQRLTALSLAGLAARNARRNPSRTQLSLGLAAVASFLIVALSAFRLAPTERGTGGFGLLATADLPLPYDLGTSAGRRQLGFSTRDDASLKSVRIVSCRARDGEDASCLNLFQTAQPRVIGVPPSIAENDLFAWGPVADPKDFAAIADGVSPWELLQADLGVDDAGLPVVPMILDRNTAMYSLKLYAVGDRLELRDERDKTRTFQLVAMLANSVLQGEVLVGEARFLDLYPGAAGSRYFLIAEPSDDDRDPAELAAFLESQLDDFGFDATDARLRLADLMAVQNTYLSTFQSLGGLGLLLGVAGLAVVQLRSMLERRGELALMRAAGFSRRRLVQMVLRENVLLLAGGLAIGCLAALAAVLPHAWSQGASVPWQLLAKLLAGVAVAGTAAGWVATRKALRVPLLPALRGE